MTRRRSLLALLVALAVAAGLFATAPAQAHRQQPRPIVFLHGFSGSGGQYETPARRFASNGYPAHLIEAQEYDSTFATVTQEQLFAQLDARIARLLAETRADGVDLVAHSLGTFLSQRYLASPERAARVAHYVNLDGAPAAAPPGGVRTLAIWGEGDPARTIAGATNVSLPGQSHTQSVTSAESFAAQYRFLTGREPRTTAVVPQRWVKLSGRAVLFPANAGVTGATLDVWRVHDRSGRRAGHRPVASFALSGDGSFGPFLARGDARYEFAIRRADGAPTHHLYFEPFRRTDRLIRLLTSEPGTGVGALVETSDRHTALTVSRNKEWWGDQGAAGDTLTLDGTDALPGVAPRAKRAIAVFGFDAGSDGVSHPGAALPRFAALPFLTGVDLFLPSRGTVRLQSDQRGTELEPGRRHTIGVPAWPSATDRVSVQFDDWSRVRSRGR